MKLKTLSLFCAVVFSSLPLFAQVDRATVTGVLRDPSGGVLTDANITITYPATSLSRSVTSNAQGVYLLGNLPVGHAVIEAGKAGFRSIHIDTDLKVGETKTFDFEMDLAGVDSTVEVVAEADLVRNSAAVGATFDDQQISQLPINGRNWSSLMTLARARSTQEQGTAPAFASLRRARTTTITGSTASTRLPCATRLKAKAGS